VRLDRLARGEAQAARAVTRCHRIHRQPLRRRHHAARQAQAQEERVIGLQPGAAARLAHVAVVLLVAAVELQQLYVVGAQRAGDRIGETLAQRAAQVPAFALDPFEIGRLGHQ